MKINITYIVKINNGQQSNIHAQMRILHNSFYRL